MPRDLIVLLDTSGSMGGGPLDKAKQVVALLIESLGDADRLELIEFSTNARRWQPEARLATASTRAGRDRVAAHAAAGGGTEMRARRARSAALAAARTRSARSCSSPTATSAASSRSCALLVEGLPTSCRLHVLGVGAAVNRSLATALARAGRGAEVLVGLDEDAERGVEAADRDRTRAPVLTNVEVAGSALLERAPEQLPDVFEGVAARRRAAAGGRGWRSSSSRGKLARGEYRHEVVVPRSAAGSGSAAIAALYGRERVADLEARAAYDQGEAIGAEIEDIGVAFQIATRMTSWVAVDDSRVVASRARRGTR